jgi:hypothetical protein
VETDADLRKQMEAIQNALRRSGRQMVLPSTQAAVRGLFVLVACGLSGWLLGNPWWQMAGLWAVIVLLDVVVEVVLYARLLSKNPEKFVTGMERQMLKFGVLTIAVGIALSIALVSRGQGDLAPALWMLLIGTAYITVSLFSFSDTWIPGTLVLAGGAAALFLAPIYSLAIMGLTLGLGSMGWAIVLRMRERRVE